MSQRGFAISSAGFEPASNALNRERILQQIPLHEIHRAQSLRCLSIDSGRTSMPFLRRIFQKHHPGNYGTTCGCTTRVASALAAAALANQSDEFEPH
jgi:hypothetical protein